MTERDHDTGGRESDDERFCFFVTPLGSDGSEVRGRADELQTLIEEVVASHNLRVVRADQIGEPGMITDQIVRAILRAEMIFADLTGANANVYYELGVAHSLNRPVVTIIDKAHELAFDTAHDRAIVVGDDGRLSFAQSRALREQLGSFVAAVVSGRYRPRNVVAEAASIATVGDLAGDDPVMAMLTQTHDDIAGLRRLLEEPRHGVAVADSSDVSLMRSLLERLVAETKSMTPGRFRNALMDGRTSSTHDEWVESLCELLADEETGG